MIGKNHTVFLADTTMNERPSAEELAHIAKETAIRELNEGAANRTRTSKMASSMANCSALETMCSEPSSAGSFIAVCVATWHGVLVAVMSLKQIELACHFGSFCGSPNSR